MLDHTHDMVQRERRIMHSLIGFALAVLVAALVWLAFYRYL
jgi:hypothetical protein